MSKSRKKTVVAILAMLAAAAAVAVGVIAHINYDRSLLAQNVDLYFMNEDNTGIVAETRSIRYRDDSDLLRNTVTQLMRGPTTPHKNRCIPRSAIVKLMQWDGATRFIVDFSDDFITDDAVRNVLETYAVVKTLCSTGCVSEVKVTVGGAPVTDRDGNELGFISASDINLEDEEYSSEMRDIVLYFADRSEKSLISEERTIKITDQQPIEQYIINELIKGPKTGEGQPLLSKNTVLISVDVDDMICYLNFKSSFIKENIGGGDHERLVIYSIVNTLTEIESISQVQFYMDGKRVENFGSVPISDYLARDLNIISR